MWWLWHILLGAVIGILARLIHPGKENMGFIMTLLIGIVGSVLGKAIGDALDWSWWISFIVAVVIAVILVAIYSGMRGKK
jgi:uncharacterized membrane protein YeaQ/YmgE (transglycosylase-associated protein family)